MCIYSGFRTAPNGLQVISNVFMFDSIRIYVDLIYIQVFLTIELI